MSQGQFDKGIGFTYLPLVRMMDKEPVKLLGFVLIVFCWQYCG